MPALPIRLARWAFRACLLEASVEKPGNVTPTRAFADMAYPDMVASARAAAPALAAAGSLGVGGAVLAAVRATRAAVGRNTNLGIVLLLAPLCRAALRSEPLTVAVRQVLAELTVADAHQVYQAIRLARPGGLGRSHAHDVDEEPRVSLREAMAVAADRDTIAREYAAGYPVTFGLAVPALRAYRRHLPFGAAVRQLFLTLLAEVPDTLIARKVGPEVAREASRLAAAALQAGGVATDRGQALERELDMFLRADGHRRNPGTTADLVAAALFVTLVQEGASAWVEALADPALAPVLRAARRTGQRPRRGNWQGQPFRGVPPGDPHPPGRASMAARPGG